jgi:hypothetical protein
MFPDGVQWIKVFYNHYEGVDGTVVDAYGHHTEIEEYPEMRWRPINVHV